MWVLSFWLGVASAAEDRLVVDRIAAIVNDEVVSLSEVYDIGRDFIAQRCPTADPTDAPAMDAFAVCVNGVEAEVLDTLIRRVLIRQELVRLGLDVTAAEVDQAIDRTVKQFNLADRAALKAEVEMGGRRWDQYRDDLFEHLRTQAFQMRVLAPRVVVTDDEMKDLYNRTARKVTRPVVKVSGLGIAIPNDTTPEDEAKIIAQADSLVASLNAGEIPWDEAVKLYDAGAAGMFLDQEFEPGSIIEPLGGVLFSSEVGVVQPPVRMPSPAGMDVLFVLRVDERTEKSEASSFDEVKPQLENQLFSEKVADNEEEWYQRARRQAAVTVKLTSTPK